MFLSFLQTNSEIGEGFPILYRFDSGEPSSARGHFRRLLQICREGESVALSTLMQVIDSKRFLAERPPPPLANGDW